MQIMLNCAEVIGRLQRGGWTLHKGGNPVHGVFLYMQCHADARCVDVKRHSARALLKSKAIVPTRGNEYGLASMQALPRSRITSNASRA